MNYLLSEKTKIRMLDHQITKKDIKLFFEIGKKIKTKRKDAYIRYIPNRVILKNKYLMKYKNIYIIERKGIVLDIFKNESFRLYRP